MNLDYAKLYPDAAPSLLVEIKQAAKACTGFAEMNSSGPEPARDFNFLNERDPRTSLWQRLHFLHLKACGIVDEY